MAESNGEGDAAGLPVPARTPAEERRQSARMPVEMWVEDLTDGGVVHRRAGNLSRGGLYLDQTIPLPLGSRVKLRFTLPDDSQAIVVKGEIVSISSRDRLGMGVKFVDVDPDAKARIEVFIERSATPPMGVDTI